MGVFPPFTNARGWTRNVAREKYLPVCNADGGVGMSEERFCKLLQVSGVPSDDIPAITSSIDKSSCGVIQLEDFLDFLGYEVEPEVLAATIATAEALATDEGMAALKELFDSIDKDHNGKVSSKEWGHMVGQKKDILAKYFGGSTPADVGRAFKRIDANGDGSLSWEEFVAAADRKRATVDLASANMIEAMQSDEGKAALKEFFDSLDKDHDGKVSSKEWGHALGKNKDMMSKYFGGSTPAEIGQAFKRIDANKDGNLTWEEFVAAADAKTAMVDSTCTAMVEAMQSDEGKAALKEFFDSLDKDHDGKVSSKEWGHALGKNKDMMSKYFGGSTPAEIGQAFKRIDANKDGNLTWEEFVAAADAKTAMVDSTCTAMVEAMQSDEGKAALKEFFDSLDKDHDGKVSSKEWGHALGKNKDMMAKYFGGSTPAEIGQAFKRIDANKDGNLTWEEFVAAADAKTALVDSCAAKVAEVMQTDDGKVELKAFFDLLDKDHDGKVSSKEWGHALGKQKDLMAKYFGGLTPAEIGQAFKRIDVNKDGKLTWEEFESAANARCA